LDYSIYLHKFTAKSLNRQAKKAQKDENVEKTKLKKVPPLCSLF
jgi:charged multivesicular body protein 1